MNLLSTSWCRLARVGIAVGLAGGLACAQAPAGGGQAKAEQSLASLSLEELLNIKVNTPSLHEQTVARAAADVTVLTADDIRNYGWRTLGEILNHARGFYVTYDHTYREAGAGGFSIPGDWSTRVLVMINGHNMTDNIFGSASYYGEDFPLDMSLVERVEIVRGTSSALYGSNGMLATINVITKAPGTGDSGTSVRLEAGGLGEKKVTATTSVKLPKGMSALASGSVFNNGGQHDIFFPEYNSPQSNNGHAINMDGERGYRLFADLKLGSWEILAFTGTRLKLQPISWNETVFNDRGTRAIDQHSTVAATWTRQLDSERLLKWETSWDEYRYRGDYRTPSQSGTAGGSVGAISEYDAGDWITSRLSYRFAWLKGNMTAGGEGKFDLRALQSQAVVKPVYQEQLSIDKRDRFAAGFLQQEWELGRHWSFTLGMRYDWSYYRSSALSPRGGAVYQPNSKTTLKLLYGRGFRNPNANELFFGDGASEIGNMGLKPEHATTVQTVVSRRLGKSWRADISAYRTVDRNIIVPVDLSSGLTQFVNADSFHGIGLGGELNGKPFSFLEVDANFQRQQSWLGNRQTLPNSPRSLGKLRLSVPLKGPRLLLSGGFLYMSERQTLAGAVVAPVWLPEVTLVSRKLMPDKDGKGFDVQVGVRNLSNSAYADPVGLISTVDTIRQPGRTAFVTVTRSFGK